MSYEKIERNKKIIELAEKNNWWKKPKLIQIELERLGFEKMTVQRIQQIVERDKKKYSRQLS